MPDSPSVDGVQPSTPPPPVPDAVATKRLEVSLVIVAGIPYAIFMVWCLALMAMLPSRSGNVDFLIWPGVVTCMFGAIALVTLGVLALKRIIANSKVSQRTKVLSLARVVAVCAPGILLGLLVPLSITGEPSLPINISNPIPADSTTLIAPLPVTYDLQEAVEILSRRDLYPTSYSWDFNGDGTPNEQTVVPMATAYYERAGLYSVVVVVNLRDGTRRLIRRNVTIPQEVFSIDPREPIVDQPITFSVAHLIDPTQELTAVEWDFDNDGVPDETGANTQAVYNYNRPGSMPVTAVVRYASQTQRRYTKPVIVSEPPPLPFPITLTAQPVTLVSPPPFGAVFSVETDEPLDEVRWDFGDGSDATGTQVKRTFNKRGDFIVTAKARASSGGDIAILTKLVRIVEPLKLPDLVFNGTPEIDGRTQRIQGEVPLTLNLTPRTNQPLIEFSWEAPEATVVGSLQNTLQVIYRRPGTYTVTLVGQDPEGRAMRRPITVEVLPPSSNISIRMTPEGGVAPLEVRFDASETSIPGEDISGFEWLFGDEGDNTPKPGGAALRHTYQKPGTYTVKLYARTTKGNVYEDSKTIVVRAPLLDACFTASRLSGKAPLGVKFTMSCSSGIPRKVEWDFGDDTKTDEHDPVHVFEKAGRYRVTLKLTDDAGTVSTQNVDISVD